MDDTEPQVRLARADEAAEIADLWALCHPASVWAQLGDEAARIYFDRFCTNPHELAVIARIDGRLVGACVGTGSPHDYTRRFYREKFPALLIALLRELARRPAVLAVLGRRLASAATRGLGSASHRLRGSQSSPTERLASDAPSDAARTCYMADFFVSPSVRGRQIGPAMLRLFAEEMARRGFDWCRVHTTVENVASQEAQRRAGFECVERRGADLTFVRRLNEDATA